MSNPFYGARPISVPFSGTADGNGNLTLQLPPIREAFWSVLKLVGNVSGGSPFWQITGGGLPLENLRGQFPSSGSFVLPPGVGPIIKITGATPGATVVGHLQGAQTSSMEDAVSRVTLVPSIVGAEVMPPQTVQVFPTGSAVTPGSASFNVGAGGSSSPGFNLPVGTKALRIVAVPSSGGPSFTYSMAVTQQSSGIALWPQGNTSSPATKGTPLFPARPVIVPFDAAFYPTAILQVQIAVTGDPTAALNFWVSALFDIESVDVWSQLPLTIQEGTSPPLWQAPTASAVSLQAALNANASVQLVAAVAGQKVFVHQISLFLAAVGLVTIEDGAASRIYGANAAAVNTQLPTYDAKGRAGGVGQSLVIKEQSGVNQTFTLALGYAQG